MDGDMGDPLLLGQRVVAILETGLRTATYKLATLLALIEHCLENLPEHPHDVLQVPIPDLAHRVLEIYWRQVRPFDGHELRQSTQPRARILIATNALREEAGVGRTGVSVEISRLRAPAAYRRAIDEITLCLAQQPLHRLQKLPGVSTSDPFLYDDSFLHDQVSRSTLRAHGDAIELKPGGAHGCNGDKSGALPAVKFVDRVLERRRDVLEEIASEMQWPTQHDRVVAAARGIYRGQPAGVPTWSGYRQSERLDISYPPWWV